MQMMHGFAYSQLTMRFKRCMLLEADFDDFESFAFAASAVDVHGGDDLFAVVRPGHSCAAEEVRSDNVIHDASSSLSQSS